MTLARWSLIAAVMRMESGPVQVHKVLHPGHFRLQGLMFLLLSSKFFLNVYESYL